MGGHGGLNILPQKRWNVYNKDNRLKVSQDEAKAREAEEAERARAEQAEREFRHQRLLRRAGAGAPDATGAPAALLGPPGAQQPQGTDQHINFWREEEVVDRSQHPEVEAAAKDEVRRRGKAEFYTSDPRFDERFQLGYQMKGDQPWWAKRGALSTQAPDPVAAAIAPPAVAPQLPAPRAAVAGLPAGVAQMQGNNEPARTKRRQEALTQEDAKVAEARHFLLQALGGSIPQLASSSHGSSSSGSGSTTADDDGATSTSSGGGSRHGGGSRTRRGRDEAGEERSERKRKSRREEGSRERTRSRQRRDSRESKHKRRTSEDGRRSSKAKKEKKGKKANREKRLKTRRHGSTPQLDVAAVLQAPSLEQLRAERLEREAAERARTRLVLVGAMDGRSEQEPQGYNSSFGYAAALKKARPVR